VVLDLAPAEFGRPVVLDQVVTGRFQGQSRSMRVRVEITADRISMTALSHLGLPLFALSHDGTQLETANDGNQLPVNPRHVLADFQFAFWPAERLGPALRERGLTLKIDADGARRLYNGNDALLARTVGPPVDHAGDPVSELVVIRIIPPYELSIRTRRAGAFR
jgi:hypothetical protein